MDFLQGIRLTADLVEELAQDLEQRYQALKRTEPRPRRRVAAKPSAIEL